jgi:hypothetical protein
VLAARNVKVSYAPREILVVNQPSHVVVEEYEFAATFHTGNNEATVLDSRLRMAFPAFRAELVSTSDSAGKLKHLCSR